jgi:hypothetical protein
VEVDVGDAGDLGDLPAELLGDGEIAVPVDADHLDVNGGGQVEVEDLAGDVRRLEEERTTLFWKEVASELSAWLRKCQAATLLRRHRLLTGLRVWCDVAARIFRGVRAMHESDTYLAILDEGQEKCARKYILIVGEERIGPPDESVKAQVEGVTDLERLDRMFRRAVKAASWQEILETL